MTTKQIMNYDVKQIHELLSAGFTKGFNEEKQKCMNWADETFLLLKFLSQVSVEDKCKSIATRALRFGVQTEKQNWVLSYEFMKIRGKYNEWKNISIQ